MNSIITGLANAWSAADARRKATLLAGVAALAIVLFLFARIIAAPTMALLYSGLDSTAASGVIEGLDRQGVAYDVRGDAIYVPSSERDRVRISLAGEGLPAAGASGYEILDAISGFGTTAEMFDAAYWRAKEGELARTILASPRVVRARVHIAQKKRRPFEEQAPTTASVTVSTASGALSRQQAEAIRYLVASAVAGLELTNVAVIDQENGVILRSGDDGTEGAQADDAQAQAETLRRRVTRLLEARVGPDAAIVEVAIDTVRDTETIRERVLDPNSKIAVHMDKEESTDAAEGDSTGVTVASNLADGDVEGGGDQTSRQASRTRERINYEMSETVTERVSPAGAIKRITVAVMVDGQMTESPAGEMAWAPRSPEEIASLRSLVESAVGFDETRGDVVTIESLQFTEGAREGTTAQSAITEALSSNAAALMQLAVLGVVALLLGLFVLKPILTGAAGAAPQDGGSLAGEMSGDDGMALAGGGGFGGDFAADGGGGGGGGMDFFPDSGGDSFALPAGDMIDAGALEVDRRDLLESTVAERPEDAARVISEWLDASEEAVPA